MDEITQLKVDLFDLLVAEEQVKTQKNQKLQLLNQLITEINAKQSSVENKPTE